MEDDVDMSLDIDLGLKAVAARPKSRFQPKLKGKILPKPNGAALHPLHPIEKQENSGVDFMEKPEEALFSGDQSGADFMDFLKEEEEDFNLGAVSMDLDGIGDGEEEDEVVREIDVFFNPSPLDSDTQLYVMQYPLRPCWRPYNLNDRCQEVRIKPKQSKVEFELAMDVNSENYDGEVDEHIKLRKQDKSAISDRKLENMAKKI